jgi:hypothetical protein
VGEKLVSRNRSIDDRACWFIATDENGESRAWQAVVGLLAPSADCDLSAPGFAAGRWVWIQFADKQPQRLRASWHNLVSIGTTLAGHGSIRAKIVVTRRRRLTRARNTAAISPPT